MPDNWYSNAKFDDFAWPKFFHMPGNHRFLTFCYCQYINLPIITFTIIAIIVVVISIIIITIAICSFFSTDADAYNFAERRYSYRHRIR